MRSFDEKIKARARSEAVFVPEGFDLRLKNRLNALPGRKIQRHGYWKIGLAAAAVCALMGATAWAYVTGAFDFLKGREEYRFLGQTELYDKYAVSVDLTQTSADGDELTIERMAMDGNFCTLFYMVRSKERLPAFSDYEKRISEQAPQLWQTLYSAPRFFLETEEGCISGIHQGGQQYFTDDGHTLFGMVRLCLDKPLSQGEDYTLCVLPSYLEQWMRPEGQTIEENGAEPAKWSFGLTAKLIKTERLELNQRATVSVEGWDDYEIELVSLSRSPLGTVLRLEENIPEEYRGDTGLFGFYKLFRDADTGAHIPFSYLEGGYTDETRSVRYDMIELYGDLSALRTLELVPADSGKSQWVTAALNELPIRGSIGSGGYEVSEVEIGEERIVVTMRPVGVVGYTSGYAGVDFLDTEGQRLFHGEGSPDIYGSDFVNWTDGSKIITYSLTGVPREYVDRIAQIELHWNTYDALEDYAVTIPLTGR